MLTAFQNQVYLVLIFVRLHIIALVSEMAYCRHLTCFLRKLQTMMRLLSLRMQLLMKMRLNQVKLKLTIY